MPCVVKRWRQFAGDGTFDRFSARNASGWAAGSREGGCPWTYLIAQ